MYSTVYTCTGCTLECKMYKCVALNLLNGHVKLAFINASEDQFRHRQSIALMYYLLPGLVQLSRYADSCLDDCVQAT